MRILLAIGLALTAGVVQARGIGGTGASWFDESILANLVWLASLTVLLALGWMLAGRFANKEQFAFRRQLLRILVVALYFFDVLES